MKNRIIQFGLISCLFLCLFIGCKKQETNNNIDEEIQIESIIDPKEWFYASKQSRIKQDPLNTIDQINGVTENSKGLAKEEKLPKWSQKREKTIKNTQIFEYEISYKVMNLFIPSSIKNSSEKKRYGNSIVNKAVFIKENDGFSLNVISFLPDPEYLKMSGYNTSKYSFIDFDTKYTGAILIYNWNSELIKAYNYKNGKKIGDIKVSWEENNSQIKKENPCGIAEPYEQWYRICTGFIVGDVYEDEYCIEGYNQQLNFDYSGCNDTNVPNNTCDDPTTPMNECDQTPGDFFQGGDLNEIIPDPNILGDFVDDPNRFEDDPSPITFKIGQVPWPTISNVLTPTQFVKFDNRNCLVLAQDQISKAGLRDLGYGSAFKVFDAQGGPYSNVAKAGVEYLISKLEAGKPVIVGVDNKPGSPSTLNADGKTDHFVTIVGSGQDNLGKYFNFYDNATNLESKGTSPLNKLYYDEITGLITGKSAVPSANSYYDYKVTQVRKTL